MKLIYDEHGILVEKPINIIGMNHKQICKAVLKRENIYNYHGFEIQMEVDKHGILIPLPINLIGLDYCGILDATEDMENFYFYVGSLIQSPKKVMEHLKRYQSEDGRKHVLIGYEEAKDPCLCREQYFLYNGDLIIWK